MIANAALFAALTVFLVVGWLAGELSFLRALQGRPLSTAREVHLGATAAAVSEPVRAPITASHDGCFSAIQDESCGIWTTN